MAGYLRSIQQHFLRHLDDTDAKALRVGLTKLVDANLDSKGPAHYMQFTANIQAESTGGDGG